MPSLQKVPSDHGSCSPDDPRCADAGAHAASSATELAQTRSWRRVTNGTRRSHAGALPAPLFPGIAGFADYRSKFLTTLMEMLNPGGRIVGTQINWERTTRKEHIDFQRQLKDIGKHPVEMTLRISYDGIDEDFSWVLTNQDELADLCDEVGLEVEVIIETSDGMYGYVLKLPPVDA